MTKREAEQRAHMMRALESLGFDYDERQALRRISMTLHRWHELECGNERGCIERDRPDDKPVWRSASRPSQTYAIPDREKGALGRLAKIIVKHAPLASYVQTDPRGAALYILRPGDVPDGQNAESYYNRGICVY